MGNRGWCSICAILMYNVCIDYLVLQNLIHLQGLPDLGEIYPLGGSADRLGFVDSDTGECLPAAMLPYCGRTLLEGLIRDLQVYKFFVFVEFGNLLTKLMLNKEVDLLTLLIFKWK